MKKKHTLNQIGKLEKGNFSYEVKGKPLFLQEEFSDLLKYYLKSMVITSKYFRELKNIGIVTLFPFAKLHSKASFLVIRLLNSDFRLFKSSLGSHNVNFFKYLGYTSILEYVRGSRIQFDKLANEVMERITESMVEKETNKLSKRMDYSQLDLLCREPNNTNELMYKMRNKIAFKVLDKDFWLAIVLFPISHISIPLFKSAMTNVYSKRILYCITLNFFFSMVHYDGSILDSIISSDPQYNLNLLTAGDDSFGFVLLQTSIRFFGLISIFILSSLMPFVTYVRFW